MEFLITLEQKYFDFMMVDRLSFDAWGHAGNTTISMNCTGNADETFWLKNAIFPAIQNFLRRPEFSGLLPNGGEKFGEIITPSGERIPLSLPEPQTS